MNIVYLCQYFYPEIGAPSARVLETSAEWVKMGHQVTVVTCFPNHPTGVIPKNYRGRFFMREMYEGIQVFRNFVLATPNKGVWRRTLCHLSFMLSSVIFSLPRLTKPDIVIASSPAFFAAFSGLVISRFKRIPFVFEVRDLWPAAIAELGVLKSKRVLKILESWELFLYRRAQKIVVVTEAFKENLIGRGVSASKIEVVYNGVDPERFGKLEAEPVKQKYHLEGKRVVLYSGALGISHSLEFILQVAERCRDCKNLLFLFVGEGAKKEDLKAMAAKLNLENVLFQPGQPREMMPEIYALADICLVSLKKVALFSQFIPSKIFEIMAGSRPIIACLEGEAARILESSGAAVIVTQEDLPALEMAVRNLSENAVLRQQMGQNGRKFVARYFNRRVLARHYEEILAIAIADQNKRSPRYQSGRAVNRNTPVNLN
jgi:glycosyltransferase involved in cell wall biosynthesis